MEGGGEEEKLQEQKGSSKLGVRSIFTSTHTSGLPS